MYTRYWNKTHTIKMKSFISFYITEINEYNFYDITHFLNWIL